MWDIVRLSVRLYVSTTQAMTKRCNNIFQSCLKKMRNERGNHSRYSLRTLDLGWGTTWGEAMLMDQGVLEAGVCKNRPPSDIAPTVSIPG